MVLARVNRRISQEQMGMKEIKGSHGLQTKVEQSRGKWCGRILITGQEVAEEAAKSQDCGAAGSIHKGGMDSHGRLSREGIA